MEDTSRQSSSNNTTRATRIRGPIGSGHAVRAGVAGPNITVASSSANSALPACRSRLHGIARFPVARDLRHWMRHELHLVTALKTEEVDSVVTVLRSDENLHIIKHLIRSGRAEYEHPAYTIAKSRSNSRARVVKFDLPEESGTSQTLMSRIPVNYESKGEKSWLKHAALSMILGPDDPNYSTGAEIEVQSGSAPLNLVRAVMTNRAGSVEESGWTGWAEDVADVVGQLRTFYRQYVSHDEDEEEYDPEEIDETMGGLAPA